MKNVFVYERDVKKAFFLHGENKKGGKDALTECCIPKANVAWERRMWNLLTERKVMSALEHLKIETEFHSSTS